mmetsp:Transcript_16371/g.46463  ORF Transcript_16371/g.46463 Transcript_16371/m.46463 type:complete len:205 (+) Transcript_16371:1192-1806(+)
MEVRPEVVRSARQWSGGRDARVVKVRVVLRDGRDQRGLEIVDAENDVHRQEIAVAPAQPGNGTVVLRPPVHQDDHRSHGGADLCGTGRVCLLEFRAPLVFAQAAGLARERCLDGGHAGLRLPPASHQDGTRRFHSRRLREEPPGEFCLRMEGPEVDGRQPLQYLTGPIALRLGTPQQCVPNLHPAAKRRHAGGTILYQLSGHSS